MAVAKSTIILASGTTVGAVINWSSMASAANNTYFDVNGKDGSKLIFLALYRNATAHNATSTSGYIYFGASASASLGSCWERTYSGRGNANARFRVKASFPDTEAKEAMVSSAEGTNLGIIVYGPYETANLKDSNGYIKVCKPKCGLEATAQALKVAAILIP